MNRFLKHILTGLSLGLLGAAGLLFLLHQPDVTAGASRPSVSQPASLEDTTATAAAESNPFPLEPPDASKISIGVADLAGYATVSGAPGAVPPQAGVVIINLDAHNVITATANLQGGFAATLFAPTGSSLLVKYETTTDTIDRYWQAAVSGVAEVTAEGINPLPGVLLRAGGPEAGTGDTQSFHIAGGDSPNAPPKRWAGWFMSGQMSVPAHPGDWRLSVVPGDLISLSLQMTATSPDFHCTGTPTQTLHINLRMAEMFGGDGQAKPSELWFDATLFTPTGLPIEHEGYVDRFEVSGPHFFQNLTCQGEHALSGDLTVAFALPLGLAEGYYRPEFDFYPDIPLSAHVPQAVVWLHDATSATALPILRVGDAAPPRIPWVLFGNELVNGARGVNALQDQGRYTMVNRVTTPPHLAVIPAVDERSGVPITYHLEPGSVWLSNSDRRQAPPPRIPLLLPSGELSIEIHQPDGSLVNLGPAPLSQTWIRTPTTSGGAEFAKGTGHIGDLYMLYNLDGAFAFTFLQQGWHTISLHGSLLDVHGNPYSLESTYEVMVAHVLDIDPNILPTTPFQVGDFFSAGMHLFPPVPAAVHVTLTHMPYSDPAHAQVTQIDGQANRFGYFQPPGGSAVQMDSPGEFRVDLSAEYHAPSGQVWFGAMTWGSVVADANPPIVAHGRRGMDYKSDTIDDMPIWFRNQDLPAEKFGIENYYPYLSGDIHWGDQTPDQGYRGDSIHSILTFEDRSVDQRYYELLRAHYPRETNPFRWPPEDASLTGLEKRIAIGEAPLFITTASGANPESRPEQIDLWGYWYGSSQRPDVRVRELISEDNMGTAYWRFDDTYGYQIGEPANGDQPGDIKWEFGGLVLRTVGEVDPIREYAIYSSLWVLLPEGCDSFGCARVTPPFQDATGASINGGPILTLGGEAIDMLFLPKCIRPGDIVELGEMVAFCGHVGPPLDSRVEVTITRPDGSTHARTWHANRIGWLYDPSFDFTAIQPGRWTVDVQVIHDRPYAGNGVIPASHNRGTVLGSGGRYEFYVTVPDSPRLYLSDPQPGPLNWPGGHIQPVLIRGIAPVGTDTIHYTIHDKGIVMGQGALTPAASGVFSLLYDPVALHQDFPMLSLTAHEGVWEGLSDEVTIHLLALGGETPRAASVTLIGEQVYVSNDVSGEDCWLFLPWTQR